jgi:hypothetical protein
MVAFALGVGQVWRLKVQVKMLLVGGVEDQRSGLKNTACIGPNP